MIAARGDIVLFADADGASDINGFDRCVDKVCCMVVGVKQTSFENINLYRVALLKLIFIPYNP